MHAVANQKPHFEPATVDKLHAELQHKGPLAAVGEAMWQQVAPPTDIHSPDMLVDLPYDSAKQKVRKTGFFHVTFPLGGLSLSIWCTSSPSVDSTRGKDPRRARQQIT